MRSAAPPSIVLPVLLVLACGDDSGSTGADGAAGTLDGPDIMLAAATEDVYSVGALQGEDWETFGSIRAVAFDGTGNLHILDTQADRIVVVAPDGGFLRTVGGPGEGPGEFRSPTGMIVDRDGGYVVTSMNGLEILGAEGEYVRSVGFDPFQGLPMGAKGVSAGRVLTTGVMRMNRPEEREESGIVPETEGRPIEAFPLDGSDPEVLYTAWVLPDERDEGTLESSSGVFQMPPPRAFAPGLHSEVMSDGRVAVADSIGYRVKLIGIDGAVTGVIERPIPPRAVTEDVQDAERERRRARHDELNAQAERGPLSFRYGSVDDMTFADEIPVIDAIAVDWDDRIWVARHDEMGVEAEFIDIVTPDGGYVGTLPADGPRIPDAFGPDGLLAYIETDEFDVRSVRVVRLVSLDR
ncbi:MAG: 6-bladed beta-propeller [Gemmatimonadetes bacterium]|nr:6-bladed beta-propeller [Gemmatimonadota bacterium]